MPRPYTPNQSCQGSDENDSSDDELDQFGASRGYYSGEYSRGNSIDYGSRRAPPLRVRTDPVFSTPMLRTSTATNSQLNSTPTISPITPITTAQTSSSLLRPSARQSHSVSGATTREPSPSFAASVTAARAAWDAKEAHKEEKREKKRRKSEQREREKEERRTSKDVTRGGLDAAVIITPAVWDETQGEKVEYLIPEPTRDIDGPNILGTGKKWGVTGSSTTTQPAWATTPKQKGPGLKKRWLGFVVWIRIGLVKMGRKFGGMKSKTR